MSVCLVRCSFSRSIVKEVDDLRIGCEGLDATLEGDDGWIGTFVEEDLDHIKMALLDCLEERRGTGVVLDLDINWRCVVEHTEDGVHVPLKAC